MTVSRLERELPHRELMEWMEEYRRDPWGTWRDNAHSAVIATIMGNAFRGKDTRALSYEDFMFVDPETAEKRRAERMSRNNRSLVAALTAVAKVH
jgi:hypothetical protein